MSSCNSFFFFLKKAFLPTPRKKTTTKCFFLIFSCFLYKINMGTSQSFRVQSHLSWNFRTKKPSMNKRKNERLQWNNRTWENNPFWFIHWFLLSFTERSDELRKKRGNADHQKSSLLRNSLCSLASLCFVSQLL